MVNALSGVIYFSLFRVSIVDVVTFYSSSKITPQIMPQLYQLFSSFLEPSKATKFGYNVHKFSISLNTKMRISFISNSLKWILGFFSTFFFSVGKVKINTFFRFSYLFHQSDLICLFFNSITSHLLF